VAKRKGQADQVIEFLNPESELAKNISKEYWVKQETEKPKLSATQVIERVREAGFFQFGMHQHTLFWRKHGAKNPSKGFGTMVVKSWCWYAHWPSFIIGELTKEAEQPKVKRSQAVPVQTEVSDRPN
jgi:hypothetical protein